MPLTFTGPILYAERGYVIIFENMFYRPMGKKFAFRFGRLSVRNFYALLNICGLEDVVD